MFDVLALATAVALSPPCPGITTIEVSRCLEGRYERSDQTLHRYFTTATERARRTSKKAERSLVEAQRRWVTYREAECTSVVEKFSGGTISGSEQLGCLDRLTRLRTYTLWRDWLTYPDNTSSLLSRPDVESVTADSHRM